MLRLLIYLFAGHALCDYPWQGDFLSRGKNKLNNVGVPWYWCLGAHCLIHCAMVLYVTGSEVCAVAEFFIHAATDYSKTRGWISADVDQYIHFVCKILWAVIVL